MASRPASAGAFTLGLTGRALLVAALAVSAVAAFWSWKYYAAGLLLAGAAVLAFIELRTAVLRADRSFSTLMDGLMRGEFDRAGSRTAGHRRYSQAVDQALDALLDERAGRERVIERLRTLADSVPAALLIIEAGGRVQLANAAARRLAGEDLARLDQMAAIGPEAAARIRAIAPGGREVVRLADGRQMLGSSLRFIQPGAPPERLVALQDVAAELDAVQVRAWQDLVRVLAHEMLNSLTQISALAESLNARGDLDPDTAASIEVIARRSLGLMDFVDRYRKVADTPSPNRQTIALGPFIADLERLLRPSLAADRVDFRCAVPPGLSIEADRQMIEQAVINLIKNATDAVAGRPDPKVAVTCRQAGERIEIAVADNGPGLSPDVMDRLFVPFFTTKPGGSGIGLSLARQIALAHHGQLEAAPATPHGAVFTLALPASA